MKALILPPYTSLTILYHLRYILSLALADLLVINTCVPFTSIVYTVESWPWGESVCKISEAAKDVSIGVSVFTLTALSADRYFAIVDPLRKLHATARSPIAMVNFDHPTAECRLEHDDDHRHQCGDDDRRQLDVSFQAWKEWF
ncbi:Neuropeptide CCHamide-1 receptor [Eumeta japonica]|uniref:Neuropeptide CCHamide-1 receptor n=1 Tax=Eumeta variegata TaxID=151549 RepID=A0A4C1XB68_EUMVA|nr:Neuropeptide CCHamide-1 receptor [Eumeta japonica]